MRDPKTLQQEKVAAALGRRDTKTTFLFGVAGAIFKVVGDACTVKNTFVADEDVVPVPEINRASSLVWVSW